MKYKNPVFPRFSGITHIVVVTMDLLPNGPQIFTDRDGPDHPLLTSLTIKWTDGTER
jgi:hypothetical protein